MGLNIEEQKAVDRFRQDVVEPSMSKLVVLDFWAEWCGPCKALTPVLEKVCGEYVEKGVVLAKVNVDEEQFIASQFQVKSIPTVYALFQGQPVADLTNARSEGQLKQMLDQLLEKLPLGEGAPTEPGAPTPEQIAKMVEMGERSLTDGDLEQALAAFGQVVQFDPTNAAAIGGMIRTQIAGGQTDEATQMLEAVETSPELEGIKADPAIAAAKAALELASTAVDDGELGALRDTAKADPANMDARLAFAEAAYAGGQKDEAADELLAMVQADREWNEGAARAKLLQIFEAIGLEDEWVVATRRRLSRILFS
ncbi:tetratricopeptide repeat protein [Erythrobacter sp. W53]|uniref:tetratricopeptide repeat protein n=1 Tax=Erythrobacter sp. W53 TaxID=3425947 RepID=UPI003D7685CA